MARPRGIHPAFELHCQVDTVKRKPAGSFRSATEVASMSHSSNICLNANASVDSPNTKIRTVQRLSWFLHQDDMQIREASHIFQEEKHELNVGLDF